MSDVAIRVEGLVVRWGAREAVAGVSFMVEQGEVVGLVGPDGSGKTSVLRAVCGLLRPHRGRVTVGGMDAWTQRRELHRFLTYVPQRFGLYPDLSVDEHLRFFGLLHGVRDWAQKREALLERVGLAAFRTRLAQELSGGMRQKLALAVALLRGPRVLVLDEATTGVDPITRRQLWDLLTEEVARGATILVSTPSLEEAERCARVVMMHQGGILAQGTPSQLQATCPPAWVVEAQPREKVAAVLGTMGEVREFWSVGTSFRVWASPPHAEAIRARLLAEGCVITRWGQAAPRLEDAFLWHVRGRVRDGGKAVPPERPAARH